jgi:hypothetical protein
MRSVSNVTSNAEVASRHVSQVIHQSPVDVYDFASDPRNLPRWASGLSQSQVTYDGDQLLIDSPMGQVTVRFVARNDYFVLDHDVTLPSGTTVNNPVRVLTHPDGAEILFTVRQIELTDDEYERDIRTVADDLQRLRALVES